MRGSACVDNHPPSEAVFGSNSLRCAPSYRLLPRPRPPFSVFYTRLRARYSCCDAHHLCCTWAHPHASPPSPKSLRRPRHANVMLYHASSQVPEIYSRSRHSNSQDHLPIGRCLSRPLAPEGSLSRTSPSRSAARTVPFQHLASREHHAMRCLQTDLPKFLRGLTSHSSHAPTPAESVLSHRMRKYFSLQGTLPLLSDVVHAAHALRSLSQHTLRSR